MKKLMGLIICTMFASSVFAQGAKMEAKPSMKSGLKMKHECYMMKDGALVHCMGDKTEAQNTAVTLKGGTVISPKGEVKMKDGKTMKLENGQCMSMMGSIGDCEKMHPSKAVKKETPVSKEPAPAKD